VGSNADFSVAVRFHLPDLSPPDNCYAFLREADGQRILVALNLAVQSRRLSLSALGKGEIAICTHLDGEGQPSLGEVDLRSGDGMIFEAECRCREGIGIKQNILP
jgi:hypothetical protein